MKDFKYYIELDVSRVIPPSGGAYGTIIAEGNTMDELLSNATVNVINQDGGEGGIRPTDDPWMEEHVILELHKKYGVME